MRNIFDHLRDDFWAAAFQQGKCVGILIDGVYHVPTDIDALCMYCGFATI